MGTQWCYVTWVSRAVMHKNKTVKANICSARVCRPPKLTLSLGEADTFPHNNNITLQPQNLQRNKRIADKWILCSVSRIPCKICIL
jgi:hypothetical protein